MLMGAALRISVSVLCIDFHGNSSNRFDRLPEAKQEGTMYKLLVPVYNRTLDEKQRAALAVQLRRIAPDEVLLVFRRTLGDREALKAEQLLFAKNKRLLHFE